jgi:RNA polymerase sigma factor (sigma-70 family)
MKPAISTISLQSVTAVNYGSLSSIIQILDQNREQYWVYYEKMREELSDINSPHLDPLILDRIQNTLGFIKNLIHLQNEWANITDTRSLRYLQKLWIFWFINFLIWSFDKEHKTARIVIPTGQWKSYLAIKLAENNLQKTIIIGNDNTGVRQIMENAPVWMDYGIIDKDESNTSKVIIGNWHSFETAYRKWLIDLREYSMIFIDEGDVNGLSVPRTSLLRNIALQNQVRVIALSATEEQASRKKLEDFYEYDVLRFPMPWSLPELHKIKEMPNATFQDVILGWDLYMTNWWQELSDDEADTFIQQSEWIDHMLTYHAKQNRGRKFIVGMRTNHFNEKIIQRGKDMWINILALTGEMDEMERRKVIEKLKNGEIDGVVGSRLSGRWLDIPECDVAYNSLLTYSPQMFWQLIGRAIRIDPTNPDKHSQLVTFLPRRVLRYEKLIDWYEQWDKTNEKKWVAKKYIQPLCFGAFFQKDYFQVSRWKVEKEDTWGSYELKDLTEEEIRTINEVTLYLMTIRQYGHYMGRPDILASIIRHTRWNISYSKLVKYLFQIKGNRVDSYITESWEINPDDDIAYNEVLGRYCSKNLDQLTISKEKELFERYFQTTDQSEKIRIREVILQYHYPLIIAIAQKFVTDGLAFEDLVQVWIEKVINDFERFEPFSRFASFCAISAFREIQQYASWWDTVVYVPAGRRRLIKKVQNILDSRWLSPYNYDTFVQAIETAWGKIRDSKGEIIQEKVSQVLQDIESGFKIESFDPIEHGWQEENGGISETSENTAIHTRIIQDMLDNLPQRVAEVLKRRFFLEETHEEIGAAFDRSGAMIGQMERKWLRILEHKLDALGKEEFPKISLRLIRLYQKFILTADQEIKIEENGIPITQEDFLELYSTEESPVLQAILLHIKMIPDEMIFEKYINFYKFKNLKKIWRKVIFKNMVDFWNSEITEILDEVVFERDVDFRSCKNLERIGKWCIFKGKANFKSSGIREIPDGTIFEWDVDFGSCKNLERIGKWCIFKGKVDFESSGITEIPDATIFEWDVDFGSCKNIQRMGKWCIFKGETNYEHSGITEIPDGTIFEWGVNFYYCTHLQRMGNSCIFNKGVNFENSGIREIPDGTIFERSVNFSYCRKLESIWKSCIFRWGVSFSNTGIKKIPDGTVFESWVSFWHCKKLESIGKSCIFGWPTNFIYSGITEIPDGTIFDWGVDFESCKNLQRMGKWCIFKGKVNFESSGITEIPDGTIFEWDVDCSKCIDLHRIGTNITFKGTNDFYNAWIIEIPDGTIFEWDVNFTNCKSLKYIGKGSIFKWNVNFESSWIKIKPKWVWFKKVVLLSL